MIVEYIRYVLKNHRPDELIDAYAEAARHLDAAPECQAYELSQCSNEPNVFVLRIEWLSAEAHLKGFRDGPHFPPFIAPIRRFIPEIAEMRHYTVVAGVVAKAGTSPAAKPHSKTD